MSDEYISIYDLVEYAKGKHDGSIIEATYELINLIKENNAEIAVFEHFNGIKPRLTKQENKLYDYLLEINYFKGYKEYIPF